MSKSRSAGKPSGISWPVPPMMTGDWRVLDDALAREFFNVLVGDQSRPREIAHSGSLDAFRLFPLSCYPGFLSVDVLLGGKAGPRVMWFLYGPQGTFPITGQSALLHDLNDRGLLSLDSDAAAMEYLRLFCSAVHGEEGPFILVEDMRRYMELTGVVPDIGDLLFRRLKPLSCQATADGWMLQGHVLYGETLFSAQFNLTRTGLVEMIDDEVIVGPVAGTTFTNEAGIRTPSAPASTSGEHA